MEIVLADLVGDDEHEPPRRECGVDPVERARRSVAEHVEASLGGLAAAIAAPLRATL